MTDSDRDPETGLFVKGKKGGPGRPRGSGRKQLADKFVNDLAEAWEKDGKDVIKRAMQADPSGMVRVVASLLPKQIDVTQTLETVSQTELDEIINLARQHVRDGLDRRSGDGGSGERAPPKTPVH